MSIVCREAITIKTKEEKKNTVFSHFTFCFFGFQILQNENGSVLGKMVGKVPRK